MHTESIQLLSLPKRQLDNFLGLDTGLSTVEAMVAALKKAKGLQSVQDTEMKAILQVGARVYGNRGCTWLEAGQLGSCVGQGVYAGESCRARRALPAP